MFVRTCKQFHGVAKGRQHNPTNMAGMLQRFALVVLPSKRAMVCLQWISMMVVVPFVALVPLALGRAWSSRRSTLHMSRRQLTWQRQPKCSFANSCWHSQRMRRRCFSGALALGKKRSWCVSWWCSCSTMWHPSMYVLFGWNESWIENSRNIGLACSRDCACSHFANEVLPVAL